MAEDDEPAELLRLDLKGLKCPLPALHTRRALERGAPGLRLTVECTDPMAVIDIPALVRQSGYRLEAQEQLNGTLIFHICKTRS